MGMDVTEINADGTVALTDADTVAIADPARGAALLIDVRANYGTRTEPADILAALDTL
jgi:hypothetical protein